MTVERFSLSGVSEIVVKNGAGSVLASAGEEVAEITIRTAAVPEAIEMTSKHRPQMLVEAGTILTEDQVDVAKEAGAKFALSVGIDPLKLAHAATNSLPFEPGIKTPSDLQIALHAGCKLVKFFCDDGGRAGHT